MSKKTRLITLSVLAVMIVICISLGVTRAFMKPVAESSSVTGVSLSSCAKIALTGKNSINLTNTYPMTKNRALQTTPYTFTVKSSCETYVGFNLYLAIPGTNTLPASDIHYIITAVDSKEIIVDGILSEASNVTNSFTNQEKTEYEVGMGSSINTIYQIFNEKIPYQGEASYDLYLYLDENATQTTDGSKSFISAVAVKAYDREKDLFADYIKGLYTDGSNGLYYHDVNLVNGANDNSYRYSGENPNNWVCFGTDNKVCDDEHLYRIIGFFGDKIKLIKAYEGTQVSLGTAPHGDGYGAEFYKGKLDPKPGYIWSGSSKKNIWTTSTFNMDVLNGTYLSTLGTNWSSKIVTTEWKVGGNTANNIYSVIPSITYQNEVINPQPGTYGENIISVNAKIGLMYVSDYGFATIPDYWNKPLFDYNDESVRNNNWLFLGANEWTLTRRSENPSYATSDSATYVFGISYVGNVNNGGASINSSAVRPAFYLDSKVAFAGGLGTETNPYRIA